MHILHLNDTSRIAGGVEVYLQDVCAGLAEHSVQTTLGYASGDGAAFPGGRSLPFLSHSALWSRRDAAYRMMCAALEELTPSVVHIHNVYNINAIAACLDTCPTFLHLHDYRYLCPASTFYHRRTNATCPLSHGAHCLLHSCTSRCLSPRPNVALRYLQRVRWVMAQSGRFAGLFANSGYVRDRLLSAGAPSDRIEVLHYFCSFATPDEPPQPVDPPYVLFVGRLRDYKGINDFVACLAQLPANVRGVMIGDATPPTSDRILEHARSLGCEERLELRPWTSRDDIHMAISAAALTIFPSIWAEPFGLVGLESQTLGVPVVAYDSGGVRDWLDDGATGRCVPPGDVKALAQAVASLLADPVRRRAMSETCLERSRQFQRHDHLNRLLGHYQQALA